MSNPTIQEMNMTIAEYMGWTVKQGEGQYSGYKELYFPSGLLYGRLFKPIYDYLPNYDSSWDALLSVKQKLMKLYGSEYTTIYFDISKEHEDIYNRIKQLQDA